jgi:cell division protein FtsQ
VHPSTRKKAANSASFRTLKSKGTVASSSRRRARAANRRRERNLLRNLPSPAQVGALLRACGKRSLPALLVVSCIALLGTASFVGYRWFTESPRFDIASVKVSGNQKLSQVQVTELLSLSRHANVFRTDMDQLESRLLANPWISSASVSRSLPDGLEVEIQEESARAAVELDGFYLINEAGETFKRADLHGGEMEGLCIITGLTRERFLTDGPASRERLRYALAALSSYHANPARPRVGELHLDPRHGISLITYENAIAIHLGSPDGADFEDRYRSFDSAWGALDSEEHAAARAFRIVDRTPSDQVTIAFAGN